MEILQRYEYDICLASTQTVIKKTGQKKGYVCGKAAVCPKNAAGAQKMWFQLDQSGNYIESGNNTRQLSDKIKNPYIIRMITQRMRLT